MSYGSCGPSSIVGESISSKVDKTIFTTEGERLIDFVLAYQPQEKDASREKYRDIFEEKLRREGLYLERENLELSQDGKTCFVKIHMPWETVSRMAEVDRVKIPIQKSDIKEEEDVEFESNLRQCYKSMIRVLCCGADLTELEEGLRAPFLPAYFTLEFHRERLGQYLNQDQNTLFTEIQRICLIWDLIERIQVRSVEICTDGTLLEGHAEGTSVGISFLLKNRIYAAAYPLHDGGIHTNPEDPKEKPSGIWPLRPWLYETWARPKRWLKSQPLDQVKAYFGEKVGLYFAWLGFYTKMLLPLTILGLVTFLYGLSIFSFDAPTNEICHPKMNGTVRRICRECASRLCGFEDLQESCAYATVNTVFSNYFTVLFALISSLWAVVFMELWKREQARLTCKWDCFDVTTQYEPPRPEYQSAARKKRRNPITHEWEPYIPARNTWVNIVVSVCSIAFMIVLVIAVMVGVIVYKMAMGMVFYSSQLKGIAFLDSSILSTVTASIISLISILVLEKVYTWIAWQLTEREKPRSLNDFEISYTYKMFLFQFINNYGTLFYLAFLSVSAAARTYSFFGERQLAH